MKQNFSLLKHLNMKKKNNYLILIAFIAICFPVLSQKIEDVTYKDKPCHIYPFEIQVKTNDAYFSAINLRKHKKVFMKMLEESKWKNMTAFESSMAHYNFKRDLKRYRRLYKNNKGKKGAQFIKAIRENPYPLLEQRYERDEDIKPCLDAIPDGTYIQYFEDFPLITKNNELIVVKDRVAGIFNIKNNVLEGEAVWFNFKGDTLKKGVFKNGLKEGEWYFAKRTIENRLSKDAKEQYIKNGFPAIDTTIEVMMYAKGVRNGHYYQKGNTDHPIFEGYYTENEFSGHWKERIMKVPSNIYMPAAVKIAKENLRHNNVVTSEYTYVKDKVTVKQPIIRDGLIMEYYSRDFNFDFNFQPSDPNKGLYKIAFEEEVDLELEEEKVNSYEGSVYDEEYGEEYYMDEREYLRDDYYESEVEISDFQSIVYDNKTGKRLFRGKAIDSVGVIFNYDGVYEKRYPNGQLMFHYEIKDGKLLKEDTIFWDNGTPFDVITYKADSNQYIQSVYDYDGKLYHELVFNSLGDFVRVNFQPVKQKYVVLDGLLAEDNFNVPFYSYDKMDTLATKLEVDSMLIWRAWIKEDSSRIFQRMYYPKDRVLKLDNYAMSGKSSWKNELVFGEDFKSWTGVETYTFKNLILKSNNSASYSEFRYKNKRLDSIPQLNVNEYDNNFNITSDNVLYKNNIPYSGDVSIKINGKRAKYKTKNDLDITLPVYLYEKHKLEKDYDRYKKTGKTRYPEYINTLCVDEISNDFGRDIFYQLFPFLESDIRYPEIYEDFNEKGKITKYKEKQNEPSAKKITGRMKDGKPDGVWTVEDQFGNVQIVIPFTNGVKNGTVKIYDIARPMNDYYESDFYYEEDMDPLYDTFPKKQTNYLAWVDNYKNGIPHGESVRYNWLGEIEQYQNYVDGFKQGKSYERNSLAYTRMTYLDDALDGYLQTYLTIKGRDSILLYDLNFQNGELQGESKSYHTNGKLSKRGFFLNGQPIDDYEAYDSLGVKYHYVKFLYSFPVEEKIWEENELSVLYTFDWRDSIYFVPSDITSSQSLDHMLSELGIGMEIFERPYYGRPSLVEKTGIDYHMTKYYPNDTIARDGEISAGKKVGCWKYYSYEGEMLYEVDYFDTILKINDSISFKAKGLLTDFNAQGKEISKSYIIEKFEKYDCSHTDHYEIRQLYTIWQAHDSLKCMNGYVKNHYDNGVLQNEGNMVNGLPSGVWKFYDPFGKLNQVGVYVMGKRDGRWLAGDLSKTKYLGDICLNPNLPDLEEEIKTREQQLDIVITNYKLGKALNKEFYDIDWSEFNEKKEVKTDEEE